MGDISRKNFSGFRDLGVHRDKHWKCGFYPTSPSLPFTRLTISMGGSIGAGSHDSWVRTK